MRPTDAIADELRGLLRGVAVLEEVRGLLAWDQQVLMPPAAAATRGQQIATLTRLAHERRAEPRIGALADELLGRADLDEGLRVGVGAIADVWRRTVAVPADLAERLGRLQAAGYAAWIEARRSDDFGRLAPALGELVAASRERASAIDPSRPAIAVLTEDFEPGSDPDAVLPLLERLSVGLRELLDVLPERGAPPRVDQAFDPDRQVELHRRLAARLGYDFASGRIDLSEHPFTTPLGRGDVRITSRVREHDLLAGLGAVIHETGHALYEQGLDDDPLLGTVPSMGLHESQSRFWENVVARSRPFTAWLAGELDEVFPGHGLDADRLFAAANRVERSFVRVEADEVTYDLHVLVRARLEVALFSGGLEVTDLPDAWDAQFEDVFGRRPPTLRLGVLQDVHWPSGLFGYFPSYTMGNLYAAGLARAMAAARPMMWDEIGRGDFAGTLGWLRAHVHHVGHRAEAATIVTQATGGGDLVADLLARLRQRQAEVQAVSRR